MANGDYAGLKTVLLLASLGAGLGVFIWFMYEPNPAARIPGENFTFSFAAVFAGIIAAFLYPVAGAVSAKLIEALNNFAYEKEDKFDLESVLLLAVSFPISLPIALIYLVGMSVINRLFK